MNDLPEVAPVCLTKHEGRVILYMSNAAYCGPGDIRCTIKQEIGPGCACGASRTTNGTRYRQAATPCRPTTIPTTITHRPELANQREDPQCATPPN